MTTIDKAELLAIKACADIGRADAITRDKKQAVLDYYKAQGVALPAQAIEAAKAQGFNVDGIITK